ncbi:MAG: Gfo/Idh/MocA family oxidoreductase [Planctomycetota bacterium]|jgi:predicted dehydrogenase
MNAHDKNEASRSSRRDFLKTTAATVTGACAFMGSNARGQEEPAPAEEKAPSGPNERVNLGLIGPGGMGSAHLSSFMALKEEGKENVQITAVCDVAIPRLESNMKAVRERQGGEVKGYKDYRALLEDKDVDCVLVATPEHWHAQMTIDALKAGKDVYVEKPLTLRLDDALRLYRETGRYKNFVQVGTQYMMYPKYQAAKKLIAEGGIGHPTFSQTSYCRNSKDGEWLYYGIDPAIVPGPALDWEAWCGPNGTVMWDPEIYFRWRRYRKWSTGIVGDLLVHQMTPLMMSVDAGWPTRVTAHGGHYVDKAMENHDQVNMTIQFEKEHTMIVAGSTCNQIGFETMIRGHMGTIYLGGHEMVMRPEQIYIDDVDEVREQFEGFEPQQALRQNFLDCVRTRKEPASPVELAVKMMVAVDLATRSMWDGKAYAYDPVNMTARSI